MDVLFVGDRQKALRDPKLKAASAERRALIFKPFPPIGEAQRVQSKTWSGTIVGDTFYGTQDGRDPSYWNGKRPYASDDE